MQWPGIIWGVGLISLMVGWGNLPAFAAEQIVLRYSPLARTIPVSALRQLARYRSTHPPAERLSEDWQTNRPRMYRLD